MLSIIISGLTVAVIIVLLIRQLKLNDAFRSHLLRLVAIGLGALLIGLLSNAAVPTERLMFGVAGSVFICELVYLLKLDNKLKRLTGLTDFLPVIIPLFFINPYRSMIGYFFGYDVAILVFALIVVLTYGILMYLKSRKADLFLNVVLATTSITMLLWMALARVNAIV